MTDDRVDAVVRRAIGGNAEAAAWIATHAATTDEAVVVAMDALLTGEPHRLDRARAIAATSRDRQLVEIVRAHLSSDADLVDALAREHLVDFPDSYIAAWIAAGARPADSVPRLGQDT